jgi:hypothetical protein
VSTGTVAGIGGAAAGAAIAAAALGGGDDPAAVPALTIATSPTGGGISDVTIFNFTVAGGSLAAPSYTWDFGDGTTAAGGSVSHLFTGEGTWRVVVRAAASGREESASSSVIVRSLTGTWLNTYSATTCTPRPEHTTCVSAERLAITQQGSSLSGQWTLEFGYPGFMQPPNVQGLSGTAASGRSVTISQRGECQRLMNGTFDAELRVLTGTYVFESPNPNCLPRQPISGTWTRQ